MGGWAGILPPFKALKNETLILFLQVSGMSVADCYSDSSEYLQLVFLVRRWGICPKAVGQTKQSAKSLRVTNRVTSTCNEGCSER